MSSVRKGERIATVGQLIFALERLGEILWEPNPQDGRREGWAVCPCCFERDLWVSLPLDDDAPINEIGEVVA